MRFRPEKSLRFTVYTPRSETVRALLALARSGNVELDPHPYANATLEIRQLQPIVTRFERLLHECGRHLPEYQACPPVPRGTLETIATAALERLIGWCERAQALVLHVSALQQEHSDLNLLAELLAHTHTSQHDLARFGTPGQLLYKELFACPLTEAPQLDLHNVLEDFVQGSAHRYYLYLGLPEQRPSIEQSLMPACKPLTFPTWLQDNQDDWRTQIQPRLAALAADIIEQETQLQALRDEPGIVEALGEMSLLRWYLRQARTLSQDDHFCYVTGWTTAPPSYASCYNGQASMPCCASRRRPSGAHRLRCVPAVGWRRSNCSCRCMAHPMRTRSIHARCWRSLCRCCSAICLPTSATVWCWPPSAAACISVGPKGVFWCPAA